MSPLHTRAGVRGLAVWVVVAALCAPAGAQEPRTDRTEAPAATPAPTPDAAAGEKPAVPTEKPAPPAAGTDAGEKAAPAPGADATASEKPAPAPAPATDATASEKPAPAPAPDATAGEKPAAAPAPQAAPGPKPAPDKPVIGAAPPRVKKKDEPDRIRGRLTRFEASTIWVQTSDGKTVQLKFSDTHTTVFSLSKSSYTEVTFGTYVGAVSEKLGDDIYSPIRRDSLSWLHKGYELRIIDEDLRGIALGHQEWDLTGTSVMTHGWVDDQEDRVLSIKYGPTDYDETDVEVPRDAPVLKMSLGDKKLIKQGARVFVGARKEADGSYAALFIFVGKDGIVPPM